MTNIMQDPIEYANRLVALYLGMSDARARALALFDMACASNEAPIRHSPYARRQAVRGELNRE